MASKRVPKPAKVIDLAIPPVAENIDRWIVFGLDPSLSRTGYSVMLIEKGEDRSTAKWLEVGSLKPEDSGDPVWVRSKAIAQNARQILTKAIYDHLKPQMDPANGLQFDEPSEEMLRRTGVIISFEAPTPGNDFLTSISRILHLVLLENRWTIAGFPESFGRVYVQMTNAATLRRLMGLKQRGAANKKENVAKAYTFLDKLSYPNLDTDACDAVLMAMMARYSASVLMGQQDTVPAQFLIALCDASVEVVGKGRNSRTRIKGILHRPEYWSLYERKEYAVLLRDARVKKARLDREVFSI